MENYSNAFKMLVNTVQDRLVLHYDDAEEYAKYLRDMCLVEYNNSFNEMTITKDE